MQHEISLDDGLLAFSDDVAAHLLDRSPLDFHAEFHRICQQVYGQIKNRPTVDTSALKDTGFDVFSEFASARMAHGLSEAYGREVEVQRGEANSVIEPSEALKEHVMEVARHCLTDEFERYIESYFGCFFRIDHFDLMRSRPYDQPGDSYKWHRDLDPMAKIHVMIYLTDSGDNSPATLFARLADTRRCAEKGYVFPPQSRRIHDLNELFSEGDREIVPVRPKLKAGDATIFTPSRILHRGIIHEDEFRDVLLLNILPSMNPWGSEINRLGLDRHFVGRNTLWIDPYSRFKPSLPTDKKFEIPKWVQLGHHFPEELV